MSPATLAGSASTVLFVSSSLPMVWRAITTRDVASYSRGNLALANAGNLVYTVYIASLPFGPVWFLHGINGAVAAFMLTAHLLWVPAQKSAQKTALKPAPAPRAHPAVAAPARRPARTPAPTTASRTAPVTPRRPGRGPRVGWPARPRPSRTTTLQQRLR